MDETVRQAAIDALDQDEAVKLVKQLVDIPSPEGEELECARFLYDYTREAGIETHLQEVEEGRGNVIAVVRGEGDGPTLMLNGHLDTSYTGEFWEDYPGLGKPGPNHRPRAYEIGDGIYGLGANNMKGGVAAAFAALRALKRVGVKLRGHVMASGVAGESEKALRNFTGSDHAMFEQSSGFERFERSAAIERLERLELAAAWMSDVPDVTGQKMAVGRRHRFSLRVSGSTPPPPSNISEFSARDESIGLVNRVSKFSRSGTANRVVSSLELLNL